MAFSGYRWFSLAALGAALVVSAQASQSPFLPSGAADTPQAAQDSGAELVGVISTNKQTLVGINEKITHHSLWVPVGQTKDGIEVVSCDAAQNRAVVRIGGQTRTLVMHESPTSTTPASQVKFINGTPALPPQPVAMTENEQKENDARMLVSDLMEIGMQQRKAYEEAQRNAKKAK
jgi:hypothetical protein